MILNSGSLTPCDILWLTGDDRHLSSQLFCVYILGSGEAAEAGSVSFLLSEYSCSPPASGSVKGTDIQVHTYSLMQELALVCVWYLPNSKKILLGMLQHDKHTFKCLDSHYPYLRLSCALLVLPSLLAHLQNRNKHYAPVESTREHHRRDTVHVDISLALFIWRKVKWQHISNLQQLIFFLLLSLGRSLWTVAPERESFSALSRACPKEESSEHQAQGSLSLQISLSWPCTS